VIDTAGNVTVLTLSDNSYTLDTGNPLVTLNTTTDISPEVQLLLFANVQLPALSMLIALIKALLTVCTTLSVEKNLISEIDKPVM
jgi:hypothetical protein